DREMVDDFIESGEGLVDKFKKLLKVCEKPRYPERRKDEKGRSQVTKNAGIEFVETLLRKNRQLESTEKRMASIQL
ncbi:hypothetical protein B0J14DRAFT_496097, partial [Halenospora varia]